jgi:hypothetical protein
MTRLGIGAAVGILAGLATATAASAQEPARFTVGGGAGISNPLHGDFDFQAASWEVAARGRPADHLTIEGFASGWRHTTETVTTGLPLEGPGGRIGTIGELAERTTDQTLAFGASLLPTFDAGRATIVAGGGANVMTFQHRFEQSLSDCVATTPVNCGSFANAHSASDIGAHVVAGVDVRLAARLIAFGQFRLLVPMRDPGSGHTAVVGGLRLALR